MIVLVFIVAFYISRLPLTGSTGEILGMCAGVFVDPETAFIGLYAVRPELQGKGIGIKIWNRIMAHINGKNAGLYAVPEHLHTYRDRAGFRVEDSIRMIVYEGDGPSSTEDLVHEVGNVGISEASEDLLHQIVSYDTKITYVDRSHLLRHTIREKDTVSLVAFETDQQRVGSAKGNFDAASSRVLGYICMRTNNIGKAMVGPLYADNDAVAELLMNEALKRLPVASSRGLLFMTLDCNPGGIRIAEKLRLECNEHLPRFFTQKLADADFNHIYCIHTPNFSPY